MTNRLDRDFHLPGLLRFALPTIIMMLVVSLYVALQTSCEKFSYNLQKRNGA